MIEAREKLTHQNIVSTWLNEGLYKWRNAKASVHYLGHKGLRVPMIEAPAFEQGNANINVLLVTGLHLEEISGPKLALTPDIFSVWRKNGVNFWIFPNVNQYGLQFSEDSPDTLLRYDVRHINYNS